MGQRERKGVRRGVLADFQILNFFVSFTVVLAVGFWYYGGESQKKEVLDKNAGGSTREYVTKGGNGEKGGDSQGMVAGNGTGDDTKAISREGMEEAKGNGMPSEYGRRGKGNTNTTEEGEREGIMTEMAEVVCKSSRLGHFDFPEVSREELVEVGQYYNRREYLHREAAEAFKRMREAAKGEGVELVLISGFRSVEAQRELFNRQIQRKGGVGVAALWSAPPGYSEHHTGYALDIGDGKRPEWDLKLDFANSEAYRWLTENASSYGFEQSFPANNAQGVGFEPWHWRFVGSEEARRVFTIPRYFAQIIGVYYHSGLLPTNSGAGILFSLCEDSMGKVLGRVRFSPR